MDELFENPASLEDKLMRLKMNYLKVVAHCVHLGGSCFDSVIQVGYSEAFWVLSFL